MPTTHLLRQEAEVELHKILHWWQLRMTDPENGGFYGRIDGNGKLHPHAEKGLILNARILWTFSAAARMTGDPAYLQTAKRAFRYLTDHFWDELNGGVYWSVDYTGAPFQTKKQVYAQAFAIYALSEYSWNITLFLGIYLEYQFNLWNTLGILPYSLEYSWNIILSHGICLKYCQIPWNTLGILTYS